MPPLLAGLGMVGAVVGAPGFGTLGSRPEHPLGDRQREPEIQRVPERPAGRVADSEVAGHDEETGTVRAFVDSGSAVAPARADRVFDTYRDSSDPLAPERRSADPGQHGSPNRA